LIEDRVMSDLFDVSKETILITTDSAAPGRRRIPISTAQSIHVIASAAKQSMSQRKERMDCFVAALLAMTVCLAITSQSIRAQLGVDRVGGVLADHERNDGWHFARFDGSMHHADDSH
jgi:hypothetical protein